MPDNSACPLLSRFRGATDPLLHRMVQLRIQLYKLDDASGKEPNPRTAAPNSIMGVVANETTR